MIKKSIKLTFFDLLKSFFRRCTILKIQNDLILILKIILKLHTLHILQMNLCLTSFSGKSSFSIHERW